MRIPGQAAEEYGEGVRIWQLRTLLHLWQALGFSIRGTMDRARAYLIIQLDSFGDPRFTHLIVNEMVPANGTLHIFARQPDQLQCFQEIIISQQFNSTVRQLHRILQPT